MRRHLGANHSESGIIFFTNDECSATVYINCCTWLLDCYRCYLILPWADLHNTHLDTVLEILHLEFGTSILWNPLQLIAQTQAHRCPVRWLWGSKVANWPIYHTFACPHVAYPTCLYFMTLQDKPQPSLKNWNATNRTLESRSKKKTRGWIIHTTNT